MTCAEDQPDPPPTLYKDPSAQLDYSVDFRELGVLEEGESLASAEWLIEGPDDALEEGSAGYASTNDADAATIWLSGGTADALYKVTCHAPVTDHTPPRTLNDVSFYVYVREL